MKPSIRDYLQRAIASREWIFAEAALQELTESICYEAVERGREAAVQQLGPSAWYSIELRAVSTGLEVVHEVGLRGHDPSSLQTWGQGGSLDEALADARVEKQPWRPVPRRGQRP